MKRFVMALWFSILGTAIVSLPVHAQNSSSLSTWYRRLYRQKEIHVPVKRDVNRTSTALLPVDFSRENEFFCKLGDGWIDHAEELKCVVEFPADFPADALVYFSAKEWDSLWYNLKGPKPTPGQKQIITIPMFGPTARKDWKPGRHSRPWNPATAHHVRELGIKFDSPFGKPLKWHGQVRLKVSLTRKPGHKANGKVLNLKINTHEVLAGKTFEVSFETTLAFKNPFDKREVSIRAEVLRPDGESDMVDCFYHEDFLFDKTDDFGSLTPSGFPQFRMRYTPQTAGKHTVRIAGRVGSKRVTMPAMTFTCKADPTWKGFIHRMPNDYGLLSYSATGDEFWGIGLNVRSPFDTRYRDVFPGTKWEPYNLNMYEKLFKKYKANGINVVEIWMSSWWLGLEWIPDAPGNHGIGHMNQWRAWKLDRLLEWAEKYDIYVILAIHNHGKFSTWCDQEWPRNPFNRKNGGYLNTPGEFFTSTRALTDYKRFGDYMLARWAHSPRILAWKLFTEIDLTGSRPGEYRGSHVATWHRKVGGYLKKKDPYDHLVTTHWSTDVTKAEASPKLATTKELDMLTLDAYYLRRHDTRKLFSNLERSLAFQKRIRKPCIVTEYGGTPWADSIPLIRQQLHFAMWHGFFRGFPTAPFLWWFPLIEEQDLYFEFKSLANFTHGETRSGSFCGRMPLLRKTGALEFYQVRKNDHMVGWVVDQNFLLNNRKLQIQPPLHKAVTVPIQGLKDGDYEVTFYDCATGKPMDSRRYFVSSNGTLSLPEFRRDVAFKIVATKE